MGRKGPANEVIKKMAELSAPLYEQFACLCVARRQAEADQFEATIKRNLPACRSRFGAGREILGYGQ